MKGKLKLVFAIMFIACGVMKAQMSDEEYSYVTMDLQGVLDLTMTTDAQVDFTFSTIEEYQRGIVKYNAVQLEVDATVAWDLYVYAETNEWDQVESFSSNGAASLPAEILMISSSVDNSAAAGGAAIALTGTKQSLLGRTNSGVNAVTGQPTAATQFLAGAFGTVEANDGTYAYAPGTAKGNPTKNKFRINYALYPGVPATFASEATYNGAALDLTLSDAANTANFAQAGYYYLEVVYSLVEDL